MNVIYRWAASKLLEDWTETTWWAESVLPEFARDASADRDRALDLDAADTSPPEKQA
jgi:hypothetical protein